MTAPPNKCRCLRKWSRNSGPFHARKGRYGLEARNTNGGYSGALGFFLLGMGRVSCAAHSSWTFVESLRNSLDASVVIAFRTGPTSRVSSVRVLDTCLTKVVARVRGFVLVGLDVF
jgi:hypothetical protein